MVPLTSTREERVVVCLVLPCALLPLPACLPPSSPSSSPSYLLPDLRARALLPLRFDDDRRLPPPADWQLRCDGGLSFIFEVFAMVTSLIKNWEGFSTALGSHNCPVSIWRIPVSILGQNGACTKHIFATPHKENEFRPDDEVRCGTRSRSVRAGKPYAFGRAAGRHEASEGEPLCEESKDCEGEPWRPQRRKERGTRGPRRLPPR